MQKYIAVLLILWHILASFNHAETVKRKLSDEDYRRDFLQLNGQLIEEIDVPSIEYFNNNFFIPQIPLKLKGNYPIYFHFLQI